MLNIKRMYAIDVQGGGTTFDYANYDRVLEELKKKRDQLRDLSSRQLHSQDVTSASFKDELDRKLTSVPQSAGPVVEELDRMIKSLENVRENYRATEQSMANAINNQ